MVGTSRPRAATSVATKIFARPSRMLRKRRLRTVCGIAPWSATTDKPASASSSANISVSSWVEAKTTAWSTSSALNQCVSNFFLCSKPSVQCKVWVMSVFVEWPVSIAIRCGSFIMRSASVMIRPANVAENIKVCLRFAARSLIASKSSEKPRSSIRSASSTISASTWSNLIWRRFTRSSKRPGVATTTCAPFNCWICLPNGIPPMIAAIRAPFMWRTKPIASWLTCCANSRVGQRTKIFGWVIAFIRSLNGTKVSWAASAFNVGSKNAAVLPEPVWLDTKRSLPSKAAGIDCSCTGVGEVKPKLCKACCNDSCKGKSAKVLLIEYFTRKMGAPLNIWSDGHRQKAAQQ